MKKIKLGGNIFNNKKSKPSVAGVFIFTLLMVYVVVLFLPIIWSIYIAFVDANAYSQVFDPQFPNLHNTLSVSFDNFIFSWKNLSVIANNKMFSIPDMLGNSVIYSTLSSLAFTLCPVIVAYATARFKYGLSKIVYGFVIVTMALPIVGSMASEIRMLWNLGVYDTIFSMVILRFNFLSIYYLILHAQFSSIPMDYSESAKVDGASNFRTMVQIIIPQSINTIVTVFVLSFITYWNDYQIPLLYLPSYPTASFGIYDFVYNPNGASSLVPNQMAAILILTLPIVLVFIIFNKRIRVSVAMGGIKG